MICMNDCDVSRQGRQVIITCQGPYGIKDTCIKDTKSTKGKTSRMLNSTKGVNEMCLNG